MCLKNIILNNNWKKLDTKTLYYMISFWLSGKVKTIGIKIRLMVARGYGRGVGLITKRHKETFWNDELFYTLW